MPYQTDKLTHNAQYNESNKFTACLKYCKVFLYFCKALKLNKYF